MKGNKMTEITIKASNGRTIRLSVEIARTPLQKLKGLMFRRHLPERHGMLFVFDQDNRPSFWTLFTWISLEAIFIDAGGRIVDIVSMPPHRPGPFRSSHACRYVLEVNQYFCKRHRMQRGCIVNLKNTL